MKKIPPAAETPNISSGPESDIILECYNRSVSLLKANSRPSGIIASSESAKSSARHYASIFGRDAAICSLGMTVSGDPELLRTARAGLETLARHQAPNGQIPKYVKPEKDDIDFWYSGCIDATLWWLIAVDFMDRYAPGTLISADLGAAIRKALDWLSCQEHQGLFLLQQNEASDWADIMPRSGFVLYSNALWCHVKKLYRLPAAQKTRHSFENIFYPFDKSVPENRRARVLRHYIRNKAKPGEFYLSFVNFSFWGPETDVLGNILSGLLGPTPVSNASRIADALLRLKVNVPYPVRVVHTPIRRDNILWRPYMQRHKQNYPYQYHNGGIWPFAGGFWVMLLAKLGRTAAAWEDLQRYARANRAGNWGFNEWFHGKSGEPRGMTGQSWNAAMFILALYALQKRVRL
jgi:glycogen debranching enzyme